MYNSTTAFSSVPWLDFLKHDHSRRVIIVSRACHVRLKRKDARGLFLRLLLGTPWTSSCSVPRSLPSSRSSGVSRPGLLAVLPSRHRFAGCPVLSRRSWRQTTAINGRVHVLKSKDIWKIYSPQIDILVLERYTFESDWKQLLILELYCSSY